jgi:tetratricopeptide (TPR) repeat protein
MSFKVVLISGLKRYPGYIALIGLVLAYVAQVQFDTWRFYGSSSKVAVSANVYIEPQPLGARTARLASFGAHEALADWYWLKLIQYYGGGDPSGRYRKLAELFDVITELSPKFLPAYQTGLLILPGEGFVDEAISLGEKGKANLPQQWEMPYYTGIVHHIYRKDYVRAAEEFERAAALPDAPPIARLFAAIYYNQADQRQTAYQIFQTLHETSDSEFVRERASKYMEHLSIYFSLEDAIAQFQTRFGRYPVSVEELVQQRIIPEVPQSPLNQSFVINPSNGQLSEAKR